MMHLHFSVMPLLDRFDRRFLCSIFNCQMDAENKSN